MGKDSALCKRNSSDGVKSSIILKNKNYNGGSFFFSIFFEAPESRVLVKLFY